jgi:hypothetical protein
MPSNPLSVIWGPDLGAAYGIWLAMYKIMAWSERFQMLLFLLSLL